MGHFWKIETPPSVFKIPKLKLGHSWKIETPPFCFQNSQIEIGTFLFFFTPPPFWDIVLNFLDFLFWHLPSVYQSNELVDIVRIMIHGAVSDKSDESLAGKVKNFNTTDDWESCKEAHCPSNCWQLCLKIGLFILEDFVKSRGGEAYSDPMKLWLFLHI